MALTARASFWTAATLVLLLPLLWDSSVGEPFREPKSVVALALWMVLAGLFVVTNLAGGAWQDPWWPAWCGVLMGGLASSLASGQALASLVALVPLAVAALGHGAIRQLTGVQRQRLAGLVVASGVLQSLLTLLFLNRRWQPEAFARIQTLSDRYAWIGTLGNPADVAIFLALPTVLALAIAITNPRRRTVMIPLALLMLAVVVGTRTMTVAAGLVVALVVLAWRLLPSRRRLAAIGAVAVITVAVLAGPLRPRLRSAVGELRSGTWASLGSYRGASYAAGLSMLASNPLFGVGFGRFEAESYRHIDPEVLAKRAQGLRLETAFGEAHSEPLQYAAETGLIGLLLAAAGLALALRRRSREASPLPGKGALLAGAAFISLFQFPLHLSAIAAQWAVLAALALPALPPPPAPAGSRTRWRLAAVLGVAVVAGLIAWQRYRAAVTVTQGETLVQVLQRGAAGAQAPSLARVAFANLESRLFWVPSEWRARLVLGSLALRAGDAAAAARQFSTAMERAERPEIRLDLGLALIALGERQSGFAHLVQAVKLNPAIFARVSDPALSRELRRRLEEDGLGRRHPWMFEATPAAQ